MGRGSSGAAKRYGGGSGLNPANIVSTKDMISMRGRNEREVDEVLNVSKDVHDEYGDRVSQLQVAELKGKDRNTMAYWDGENIAVNQDYFDSDAMTGAYDACVQSGFHPSRGDKTGMEAVAAHEYGHNLTGAVGKAMGLSGGLDSVDEAATRIVNEARKNSGHKGVVQMAQKISTYATHSNAEAVAEAFADVYCNGGKAKKESRAIVDVINKWLK